ncbi:MAG: methyl-accepting chemotaxis protein [Lachnospiraceae bacterium]|jgi:methyl-accepting chemotaxis protein|nr:methyl-accepting chemotaxis protein [Lachnospiraceae bacterium]
MENTEFIKTENRPKKRTRNIFTMTTFQNVVFNLAILIAFIIYAVVMNNAMTTIVNTAVTASTNQSIFQSKEGVLRQSTISIYGDIHTIVGAVAAGGTLDNVSSSITSIQDLEAQIPEYVDYITTESLLISESPNGPALAEDLKANIDAYLAASDEVISAASSGDAMAAISVLTTSFAESYEALNTTYDSIEVEIEALTDGLSGYLNLQKAAVSKAGIVIMIIVVLIILASLIVSYIRISLKIKKISRELNGIINNIQDGNGDLTSRINTFTDTEIQTLSDGINLFIETLQGIIRGVKDGTVVLTSSSEAMTGQIQRASDNITNTSAALEELSASMDTVAATASEIDDNLDEVKNATELIHNEANEGTQTAASIRKEADEIKNMAAQKKENTGAKMEELSQTLTQSVKDSEKVSQINDLTNEILSIASQTNLLALNASIEAARAGEAGKGFAVVADEISALADNSRQTASNIQGISAEVTEAVRTLSENAMEVIEFINQNVLADYDSFVETGDKYENTAIIMDDILSKFTELANNLNEIMQNMANNVTSITDSVRESSEAINMSAINSTQIVDEISQIDSAMDENNRVTSQLNENTKMFVNL